MISNMLRKSNLGGVLLVAGCCIGAGMLGLPLVTRELGWLLSMIPLFIGWGYMYLSGLMILEVYLEKRRDIHFTGLLEEVLGKGAKVVGAALFSLLFYSILTAYINAATILTGDCLRAWGVDLPSIATLMINVGPLFLFLISGTRRVEFLNRYLTFFLFIFYFSLISIGSVQVRGKNLFAISHPTAIIGAIPIFILSFGFQNLIPTIAHYFQYNRKSIQSILCKGTGIALVVYLIWNGLILGMISNPREGVGESSAIFLKQLFNYPNAKIAFFLNGFSFFAIATSLLSVALSVTHFLANRSDLARNRPIYTALAILPPAIFSLADPNVFLKALKMAGGIGAVALFGILPAMMVWKMRYTLNRKTQRIFPLGKRGLFLYLLISLGIIAIEVCDIFG